MTMPKTEKLTVELGDRSYPIYIGSGILQVPGLLKEHIKGNQVMVVTNETVAPLYLQQLLSLFEPTLNVATIVLPDGEQYKTLQSIDLIYDALLVNKFNRSATLVALGGGVIGDMTGFAAATYQRGINFIQIPTTLLSQVDSSVGGKTGVNHRLGKNMIGAFYQPKCVLIDIDVLSTLPERELSAGLAEVIKYGVICDIKFFEWLEENVGALLDKNDDALKKAIKVSCKRKADVVAEDEKESGIRATLNYGHTFGHAIEASMGYGKWLHGEAVGAGMTIAADLSFKLGLILEEESLRIKRLCENAKLPTRKPSGMTSDEFMKYMSVDKKNISDKVTLILLKEIGCAFVTDEVANIDISKAINDA